MTERLRVAAPRYRQIAADIAAKIADKQFQVGEKIYARSLIASQYAVSPETARRAIAILSDMGIVETAKGSGVVIRSSEKAALFVRRYGETHTLAELKVNTLKQAERLFDECLGLKDAVVELVERAGDFRSTNPFVPFQATVEAGSHCIGFSISDLRFWHQTVATVVGIRRDDVLTLSPGPYEALRENDVLYFVGDENALGRVISFLRE